MDWLNEDKVIEIKNDIRDIKPPATQGMFPSVKEFMDTFFGGSIEGDQTNVDPNRNKK